MDCFMYQYLMPVKLAVTTLLMLLAVIGSVNGGPCKVGHGYPVFCPVVDFPANHTRCCRNDYTPSCCEERANHVCVQTRTGSRSTSNYDPGPNDRAIFCPQPGQTNDFRACCTSGSTMKCCSTKLLAGILGGVFGGILLIGIIIGIVCCCLVHRGVCVCVKVRPGKWTMVTRKRAQTIRQQNEQRMTAQVVPSVAPSNVAPQYAVPHAAPPYEAPQAAPTMYSNPHYSTAADYSSPPPAYSEKY